MWSDENPHAAVESSFEIRFSVNVCSGDHGDQLIGPLVVEGRLTGDAYLRFLQ